MVSFHVIFKIRNDDNENLKLKEHIVVHGNIYADRYRMSSYFVAAYMVFIMMLLSIGKFLGFTFVSADIKCAFMQAPPLLENSR